MPQSPNFPLANATAHEAVMQRVTDMFKLNFPYTTVYPALGNLDVLHKTILESQQREFNSGSGSPDPILRHRKKSRNRGGRRRKCESLMKMNNSHVIHVFTTWLQLQSTGSWLYFCSLVRHFNWLLLCYTRLFNESAEFYICWQIAVVVVYKQLLIRARYKNHEELSKANKTV